MIDVIIKKTNKNISEITISGHANSSEYGTDLICAGVSAISVGILNSLVANDFLNQGILEMKEGYISIVVNSVDQTCQVILETLEISLDTILEGNQKFISINKMEV
ncbi:ribosomal-processing cysteine protease Prp [Tannockella kyphosi]|uniref:ribosomal-processing cysteine protease Prp n=1 Tax=Tannockella kyphosi TaxID=2899121 RepID=UPI0020138C31|nr:ribosomal-processing cysteine protease Prp [Tannockella kyphosi]